MEYVFGTPNGAGEAADEIPSYMVSANNHNTGNLNEDWYGTGEAKRTLTNKAYNMVGSAVLSGINSFYNTAVWAGNMFSDEGAKYRDTRDLVSSFDDDMGKYYEQNREAADLIGFVASSLVPGLGGVKIFNAGAKALTAAKEGAIGINMAKGLGILPGARDALVKEAATSFATTRTAFTMSNPQTVKAIAAGFGEQVLQAAAFETAVAVTMKKSPILSDLDAGDMLANIATGALLGGAIGGAIEGAITVSKIKKGIGAVDTKLAGVTQVARGVDGTSVSDDILIRRNDLDTLAVNAPEGVDQALYQKLWEQKIAHIDNADRTAFTKLANGNAEVGNRLYEGMRTDPTGTYAAKVLGLEGIYTASEADKVTRSVMKQAKHADGVDLPDALLTEADSPLAVRHFKLWGDDMGKVSDEAPAAMHLADMLKPGQQIQVRANQVQAGKNTFQIKKEVPWSPATATYEEALARNIWAMDDTVPALALAKGQQFVKIGQDDIPMLTKAYREGFTQFRLVDDAGQLVATPSNKEELLQYIGRIKNDGAVAAMEEALNSYLPAGLKNTRGTGVRFHGTSTALPEGGPTNTGVFSGSVKNIYGQGFYTTDAVDIAKGYTNKGRGADNALYDVKEKSSLKMYDMEKPMSAEVKAIAKKAFGDLYATETYDTGKQIDTLAKLFDEVRASSKYQGYSADEVQELFDSVTHNLQQQGYRGFKHTGGATTGNAAHEVKVYWFPETDLKVSKTELAKFQEAGNAPMELNAEHIANKYDVPLGFLTGEQFSANTEQAVFGLMRAQKKYWDKFHANTPAPVAVETVKPWLTQQNYQMLYDTRKVAGIDNFQVEAMTVIKQRQKLQQETNEVAVTAALGERAALLPEFTEAELTRVNRGGAGAGFFSFANANYGTAGSKAEYVGSLVTRWVREAEQKVADTFTGVNYAIVNSPTETARLAAVLQKVRAAGSEIYVLDDAGEGLILRSVRDYERAIEAGIEGAKPPHIPTGVDEVIKLGSETVRAWVKQHIALNGERLTALNNIRGAKGQPSALDPAAFYPPTPNPDRFKFHAFVVDDAKVTSTGHTTMLYADSAQALEKQIAEARAQGFNAFTPQDTADYYRARGLYDYSKGLNESQMNKALTKSGSSAPAFPLTGTPQEMIQDLMQWHAKEEAIVIRESVATKYSRQFGVLKQMGDEYAKVANAKFGILNKLRGPDANPFEDYVKTFLGASLKKDYPLWTAMNNFVDEAGQKVYNTVSKIWNGAKSPYDLQEVNRVFDRYGMQMAATPAQLEAWVNHPAGTAVVSKFVSAQNSILSSLVLRLDPVNALNNAVGSPILTGAETKAVLRAIQQNKPDAIGELAELAAISVPGAGATITSASKLISSAYKNYFSAGSKELLERYKARGFVTDTTTQFKQLLDVATIEGTETAAQLESKMAKMFDLAKNLADKGEKWTGNKLAEEMNRFVSANIMDQITSVAVKNGIFDQRTADSYINTFVNRTQGNIIASQRPQIFQGPVGQAIGLFQSYQFNIMQQLLRYVGEGSKKDALTLMGLQGTIYGMNGLPAFQAINQHIIGNASGNTTHTDAYKSVYNAAGKEAGDWIMYGAASNMLIDPDLKINLYSRGDINPRQITVVPSNMADIPIVASWAKLAGSVKTSLESVANGGDLWNTFLTGIEQQGINRPLAGLARVARGADESGISYSTSGKGNIVSANDFYSIANFARLSGAKPFDEAVTQDAMYRVQAYQAKDKNMREQLGKAVKSVVASGGTPSPEQIEGFMEGYAKSGGKQEEFNRWFVAQVRNVSSPQANKLVRDVQSPYSSYMQSVMGGRLLATPDDVRTVQTQQTPEE